MKANEIKVGGRYTAKVSGVLTTVKVEKIRERDGFKRTETVYDVLNERTGRRTTFRSAAKFRGPAGETPLDEARRKAREAADARMDRVATATVAHDRRQEEAEQRPDPTEPATPKNSPSTDGGNGAAADTAVVPRASINARLREAQAARDAMGRDDAPHLIVMARAGTGKTTTLVEGLKVLKGLPPRITPSPQQRAVWDSLLLSAGKVQSIGFVAFNRSIARELQERVPPGCEAMTMHSLGNKAVTAAFGRVQLAEWRVRDILADLMGMDGRRMQKDHPVLVKAVEELVGLCKMNLTDLSLNPIQMLDELARHYDIDLNGQKDRAFKLVPQVLDLCRDVSRDRAMDYNDMIWLPVVLDLPVRRFDLLLVDEAQDLNRCQQALAKMAGKRLVLVGDDRQAIYGFAGADSESLARMRDELASDRVRQGVTEVDTMCQTLPLTVTRRCGKAIVAEARRYVPDFEAHEGNPEGLISDARYPGKRKSPNGTGADTEVKWEDSYAAQVADGDFVLCRTNAPLVSQCFAFIKRGMRANIQGRDVGAGLTGLVKKLEGKDEAGIPVAEFVRRLDDWYAAEVNKEQAKRNPSETKLQGLTDRYGCLMAFADGARTSTDVKQKIDSVFTDDKTIRGVRLSSGHLAKGLEARRVFWLRGDGNRTFGPPAERLQLWELGQEENLAYVITTRAIEELVIVS